VALDPVGFGDKMSESDDLVRYWLPGTGDVYTLGHPEYAKRMLLTDREKFRKTSDFKIAFGEGLLTVEGEEWRQQRDVLQPLFTRRSVVDYADGMVEQVRRRTDTWTDGQQFDLQAAFTRMTQDVLFATVLGRELELGGDEQLREAAEALHDWFVPSSYFLPEWVPTPSRRRFKAAKATIEEEAQRLLDEKSGNAPADPSAAEDLLSLLVGLRESGMEETGMLTDERLRDQMVTIIFTGHDTTTTTLTFACWALANHPEVRERFHAEVDELDGPPTMDDLDDLEVTDDVVTETLRLFPPVHNLPRKTATGVAVDGHHIPEDERVHVPIMGIQRDERFFDDPDEFRPSRWDGDLRRELPDFAYMPFGGGPRVCIGRQFALLEAKLTLATIGREFDLYWLGENTEDGEPPTSPEMTLRMQPGQEFLVTER
jgi:cytochrome P450